MERSHFNTTSSQITLASPVAPLTAATPAAVITTPIAMRQVNTMLTKEKAFIREPVQPTSPEGVKLSMVVVEATATTGVEEEVQTSPRVVMGERVMAVQPPQEESDESHWDPS